MRAIRIPIVTSTLAVVATLVAAGATPAAAAPPPPPGSPGTGWCATHPAQLEIALAQHRLKRRQLQREFEATTASGRIPAVSSPDVRVEGHIAVIVDDGTIISSENLFDMANRGLRFKRIKKIEGLKTFRTGSAGFRAALGEKLEIGDDDSVEVDFPGNVRFPFYGERYDSVWVNSDGNLTFVEGDNASTQRSLSRFLAGPPRIAPFFNDLNPETAVGRGGVYVRELGKKLQITWFEMPEFGSPNLNTTQVTLFPKGKITIVWKRVDARTAVVGVTPGGDAGLELTDLNVDPPLPPTAFAVAENFTDSETLDLASVTQTFLGRFQDVYSHVILFTDFIVDLGGALAFEMTVKNDTRGIGLPLFDRSRSFGSDGALESFVQMGPINQYRSPKRRKFGTFTSLDILGQETGHRWLSFVRFRDAQGNRSNELLGRQAAHWSFRVDSDASVMEGNEWRDNGDGTFTSLVRDAGFSPLDRYLMGLIGPEEVPDFFYIKNAAGPPPEANPEFDVTLRGQRTDVSVDAVIAAEGRRRPSSDESPKEFNMGFVLLVRDGEEPQATSVELMEEIRSEWERYFRSATGRTGTADTTLKEL